MKGEETTMQYTKKLTYYFIYVDAEFKKINYKAFLTLHVQNGDEYKRAVAFTLANDYGFVKVMSSYSFYRNDQGPPHESDKSIKSVTINDDGTCGNGWVCEHRWDDCSFFLRHDKLCFIPSFIN